MSTNRESRYPVAMGPGGKANFFGKSKRQCSLIMLQLNTQYGVRRVEW
jgi:hypothetical protein